MSGVFENFPKTENENQSLNINVNQTDFSKKLNELDDSLESYYIEKGTENRNNLQ